MNNELKPKERTLGDIAEATAEEVKDGYGGYQVDNWEEIARVIADHAIAQKRETLAKEYDNIELHLFRIEKLEEVLSQTLSWIQGLSISGDEIKYQSAKIEPVLYLLRNDRMDK